MSKKFNIIVADPAWKFSDKLQHSDVARGADANYKTMTISDIKQLNVKGLSDDDGALLALWVPSSLLQEGLDTMKAWGFTHKQTYVWVKTKKDALRSFRPGLLEAAKGALKLANLPGKIIKNSLKSFSNAIAQRPFDVGEILSFGMGRLFRQTHEICLIGTNNNKIYKQLANKSQRSVSFAPNLKHSAKPEHLQDSLEIMFPYSKKIELFARRSRPDWVCLGNEVCNGEDITVSIAKLI